MTGGDICESVVAFSMANNKRHRRTPPHSRRTRRGSASRAREPQWPDAGRYRMDVTQALDSGRPLAIASVASHVVEAAGNGLMRSPTTRQRLPDLAHFVDELMDNDVAETTALLHAIAVLTPDAALAQYIHTEVARRTHVLADDITGLAELRVVRAWVAPDDDGIGETWVLELRGPGLPNGSAMAYVDHRFASGLKMAGLSDHSAADVIADLLSYPERTLDFDEVPLEQAGAKLRHALDRYAEYEDEVRPVANWPGHRPLLAHVLRSLPTGGEGYPCPMRTPKPNDLRGTDAAKDSAAVMLAEAFCDSPFRATLLPDSLVWPVADACAVFGTEYVARHPAAWTPELVAWIMTWGLPSCVDPRDPAYASAPRVFGDLIRFWHDRHGIGDEDTTASLAAVSRWEATYFQRGDDPVIARRRARTRRILDAESA